MPANDRAIVSEAWALHKEGRTSRSVGLLDHAMARMINTKSIVMLAHCRAHILMSADHCEAAEAGLRQVLGLPHGESRPAKFPFECAELMEDLFIVLAVKGETDEAVLRWLVADAQDQADSCRALSFAGILISSLQDARPREALRMALRWKDEAVRHDERGHAEGLRQIVQKLERKVC